MKRSGAPRRKTGLRSGRQISEDERKRRVQVREQVIRRDRTCVLNASTANRDYVGKLREPHRCFGDRETMHHLKKSGQGGGYTFENLVLLCAAANTWVEDNPHEAHRLGLVRRAGE